MSIPIYQVEDVIYLAESAKLGFIESYQVSGVRQSAAGAWFYRISIASRPPNSNATFGDRITLRKSIDFELAESELITYCEAVDFAVVYATNILAQLQALKLAHCTDDTDETGGSE